MKRIDALGTARRERLQALDGAILEEGLDEDLQALVVEASRTLGLPIALVSLVLERTQFFRAHVGLPPDLAIARATDRDASFCQFVVRDGRRFEVTHASADGRVPQELVERYGIEAYLGEPVTIGGAVVGSLCVIGTEPRTFTDDDRAALTALAARVTRRLGELSQRERATSRALIARAAAPAFAEVRNIMGSLVLNAQAARIAAADARPLARLVREIPQGLAGGVAALGVLAEASRALETLATGVADIDEATGRLMRGIEALQALVRQGDRTLLVADVIDAASRIALHQTKLVGGVAWGPAPLQLRVRTPRMVAVSVVAAGLGVLAEAMEARQTGIAGTVRAAGPEVAIELRAAGVRGDTLEGCVATLAALVDEDPHVGLGVADGEGLVIRLASS
jgi:GAF domain-containing protein